MDVISLLSLLFTVFVTGANAAFFIVMKFNDLVHLEKKVNELISLIKDMDKKLDDKSERISKLEGKCKANHGI